MEGVTRRALLVAIAGAALAPAGRPAPLPAPLSYPDWLRRVVLQDCASIGRGVYEPYFLTPYPERYTWYLAFMRPA